MNNEVDLNIVIKTQKTNGRQISVNRFRNKEE